MWFLPSLLPRLLHPPACDVVGVGVSFRRRGRRRSPRRKRFYGLQCLPFFVQVLQGVLL